jgi:Conserved hypothetical ATP binding protein
MLMANLRYVCSLMSKTGLPLVLTCTKTDEQDAGFVRTWMTDPQVFQHAVKKEIFEMKGDPDDAIKMLRSMGYVIEEFEGNLDVFLDEVELT